MKPPKHRLLIMLACALIFGALGFAIGMAIDTQHPDDRIADILIPTLIFVVAGTLFGLVVAQIYYRRFWWLDGIACFLIPPIAIYGFFLGKSGNSRMFGFLEVVVLAMLGYLFVRYWLSNDRNNRLSDRGESTNAG